jgi:hypothetical protein
MDRTLAIGGGNGPDRADHAANRSLAGRRCHRGPSGHSRRSRLGQRRAGHQLERLLGDLAAHEAHPAAVAGVVVHGRELPRRPGQHHDVEVAAAVHKAPRVLVGAHPDEAAQFGASSSRTIADDRLHAGHGDVVGAQLAEAFDEGLQADGMHGGMVPKSGRSGEVAQVRSRTRAAPRSYAPYFLIAASSLGSTAKM